MTYLIKRLKEGVPSRIERWPGNDGEDIVRDTLAATKTMQEAAVVMAELLEASKALLTACEVDCGPVENDDGDDESVGASLDGPMALTFGHMRRAAAAIAKAEGRA